MAASHGLLRVCKGLRGKRKGKRLAKQGFPPLTAKSKDIT